MATEHENDDLGTITWQLPRDIQDYLDGLTEQDRRSAYEGLGNALDFMFASLKRAYSTPVPGNNVNVDPRGNLGLLCHGLREVQVTSGMLPKPARVPGVITDRGQLAC